MPRDGSGIYHTPAGTDGVPDTTIDSAKYNTNVHDVELDLNTPRPIVAGGTGGTTPDSALTNLSAEKYKQVVTNWDSTAWMAGSFYAATTATGAAPVPTHAFAGIAYFANATDFVNEAIDLTDVNNPKYTRVMTAGVWGPWSRIGGTGTTGSSIGEFIFNSAITFPPAAGEVRFNNATQNATTELFISHLTATGVDVSTSLPFNLRTGYDIAIADRSDITKYKVFTITADPVLSGGDIRVLALFKNGGVDLTSLNRVSLSTTAGSPVRYDIAQALTEPQKVQARQNIYAAPFDALAYNGMQINGSMEVNQEVPSVVIGNPGSSRYIIDGWKANATITGTLSIAFGPQQLSSEIPGFSRCLQLQVTAAQASMGSDIVTIEQHIEGYRFSRAAWGYPSAVPITIGFWVRASVPGNYRALIVNDNSSAATAWVPFNISASGVFQWVTLTFPAQTTGAWKNDNSIGAQLLIDVASSATPPMYASASAFLSITGVIILPGIEAPSAARSAFIMRPYDQELLTCQRYWEKGAIGWGGLTTIGVVYSAIVHFKVVKRIAPTVVQTNVSNTGFDTTVNGGTTQEPTRTFSSFRYPNVAGISGGWEETWTANARL